MSPRPSASPEPSSRASPTTPDDARRRAPGYPLSDLREALVDMIEREALTQREDPIQRGGGLRAAALYPDRALRDLALNALTSAYVLERQELVRTLLAWGGEAGLLGLKELAVDKSVSVRQAALEALGALGGAEDLLKSYALDGPDEGTAESAARAWLRSAGARVSAVALELLSSSYEEARAVGVEALVSGGAASCAPLAGALLSGVGHGASVEGALRALWGVCEGPLFDEAARRDGEGRARLFGALQRWGERGSRARDFTAQALTVPGPEGLRAAAAQAQAALAPAERLRPLRPLLTSPSVIERCAALSALCAPVVGEGAEPRPVEGEARALCLERVSAEVRAHLPTPARDREALTCALRALSELRGGELDELLAEAYGAWSSSIAYGDLRLALTRAAASPAPTRLSTLMEAMLDSDPRVKAEAERALRR